MLELNDPVVDSDVQGDEDQEGTEDHDEQVHPENVDPDVEPVKSELSRFQHHIRFAGIIREIIILKSREIVLEIFRSELIVKLNS